GVLRAADRAIITQAITGLGGVGKSQLAAQYAYRHSDDYDIVAWIGAEDGGIADLSHLAVELGLATDGLAPSELAHLALKHLAHTTRRWLLVLDNVSSPEQLAALRPDGGSGRVLVTSRDRALRQFGRLISVDVFDLDTATRYLTDRADRPRDQRAARQLAGALGCLPLALSHAAAYCQLGTSFTEYHALLRGLPACDLFSGHPELSYKQTVASTWLASIEAADTHAPLAAQVLEVAAYLAPDAIPKTLFAILLDDKTPRSRKHLADAFGALARYSLAVVDDDTISVHRLLQKTVRDALATREDRRPGLLAIAAVDERFPREPELPACWALCEQLLAHAHALADMVSDPADQATRLVDLLNRTCWYLSRA
ncbi:MAG: hypothetical protein LC790_10820, partial [Actinobacteria bacterium]|nr:hypothetical protein [Actinomycetota bacterium]